MKEFRRARARVHHRFGPYCGRLHLALLGLVITICAVNVARAQDPQALLQQYRCYICHADTETLTGPAFVDVAAKYKGRSRAVAMVSAVIKNGARSGGPWHMPPHPEVSDAEAKLMARYILSLKPETVVEGTR